MCDIEIHSFIPTHEKGEDNACTEEGWYLNTSPIITANWEAASDDQWTIPIGGGVGRLVRHGKLPVDYRLAAYWNVEKPEFGPEWQLQFTVKFLFPK